MANIKARLTGYALGAELTGVDLSSGADEATISAIRQALLDHIVVCLPKQRLRADEFAAFCSRFGELDVYNTSPRNRHPSCPAVYVNVNQPIAIDGTTAPKSSPANQWHSDYSHSRRPGTFTFLLAKNVPDVGGDTMFANLYRAYESLSPAFRRALEPLDAVHDSTLSAGYGMSSEAERAESRRRKPPVAHPLVRTHPETGRKALFVTDRIRTFVGMTEDETKPIAGQLLNHATRYEFVYRHRWSADDLLIWDNRCALHNAVQDYDHAQLRSMLRCSLVADLSGYVYGEDETAKVSSAR